MNLCRLLKSTGTKIARYALLGLLGSFTLLEKRANGLQGMHISELPAGGNVTLPGDFPVIIRKALEAKIQSVSSPQSIQINSTVSSVVKIFANHENTVRTVKVSPGAAAVYSFKSMSAIRIKVIEGEVRISSISPLRVEH